ncbi:hypothetical protein MRX96_025760 [Rhipicephalus microplus]
MTTVKRRVREAGLKSRIAAQKPLLRAQNKEIRLQFSRQHAQRSTEEWKQVVFTDECTFTTSCDQQARIWRPDNTRAEDRGQDDDCGVCPATHIGQCQLPINEPWVDEGRVYQVQKQDWMITATGRETGINMAVPLTHFLLLKQVIYCSVAKAHHRNGSASTERHTSATTLFRAEDRGQDDDCGVCPATHIGQCQLPINEPWADEGRVYQVQKQDWMSTATGHDAGINMTVPLTHFLLLTQVIYCSAANAHHRNGSASTERYTSATTLFRTED